MTLTLEEAIAKVPFLVQAKELKATPLGGGITNRNFRIDYGGQSCVLRITGENTEMLGIRRDVEYIASLAAGELGIAPPVLYLIEPEGYLITRFIHGENIPLEEIVKPVNLNRFAEKIRRFHRAGPNLPITFDVFDRIRLFIKIAQEHHCVFPENFTWFMERVKWTESALKARPSQLSPCHNDLLNLNFMIENGELYILDWEYAGMGDPLYDLANFSHHHLLSDEQIEHLLHTYFGEVSPTAFARVKLYYPISQMYEALWGVAQTGISTLDEDFQGYADMFFARAEERFKDSRFEQWMLTI